MVPTFIVAEKLHMVNSYQGLILPIVAQTGFGTLLFRQYLVSLPGELIDAARVDGSSWFTILIDGSSSRWPPRRPVRMWRSPS